MRQNQGPRTITNHLNIRVKEAQNGFFLIFARKQISIGIQGTPQGGDLRSR